MLWLLACVTQPDPCLAMCEAGAALYGGCLAEWGADWTAAGYADEDDFLDACDTWAFEWRQIEAVDGHEGQTDATCVARAEQFSASTATCDDFTSTDWNSAPWLD
ncbi:MAG: hypothetical protein FJ102_23410 [Deltaproteobacteria bacterium]|nr:hypothetical protein [Deltaproteobacteria bacterium]